MAWPMTKEAASEHSHSTAAAISSGVPIRPIGSCAITRSGPSAVWSYRYRRCPATADKDRLVGQLRRDCWVSSVNNTLGMFPSSGRVPNTLLDAEVPCQIG